MHCTKCGKEIPEGETKICDECQKKILEEITNAEKYDDGSKKNNEDDKKFSVSSEQKVNEKKNVNKKTVIAIILLLFIFIFAISVLIINYSGTNRIINNVKEVFNATNIKILKAKTEGNTIGNIRNYGYAATSGNWIYYLAPNDDSSQVGIFRVKKDGTDKEELYMNVATEEEADIQKEIVSINTYGDYIYFIGVESKPFSDTDTIDNKIYRMKNDGTDLEIINDNEFNNDCYEIYVINGYVYYIDVDANIARMNQDGSNKTVIAQNGTGYLGITDKYIVYNSLKTDNSNEYETYIMNIDGRNPRPIFKGKRIYSVNIEDDYIYYTNDDKKIYKSKIDSGTEELVYDSEAYNLNVYDGYAYFLNYKDAANENYTVCIYKVTLDANYDGKSAKLLKELESYSSFLNVIDDWALYMDSNEDNGFINLIKTDDSGELIKLYILDYEKYYKNIDTTTTEEQPTEGEPVETTENTTNEVSEQQNVVDIQNNVVVTEDTNTVVQNNVNTNEISTNTVQNTTNSVN